MAKNKVKKSYAPRQNKIIAAVLDVVLAIAFLISVHAVATPLIGFGLCGVTHLQAVDLEETAESGVYHGQGDIVRAKRLNEEKIEENVKVLVTRETFNKTQGYELGEEEYERLYLKAEIITVKEDNTFTLSFFPNIEATNYDYSLEDIEYYFVRNANGFGKYLYNRQGDIAHLFISFTLITMMIYFANYGLILRFNPYNSIEKANKYTEKRIFGDEFTKDE